MAAKKSKAAKKVSKKSTKTPAAKKKVPAKTKKTNVLKAASSALETSKEINKKLEEQNESLKDLDTTSAGAPIVTYGPTEAELAKLAQEERDRAAERERVRVRAREERARMKAARRREQELKKQSSQEASNVTSLADARARQGTQPKPAAIQNVPGVDEGPKQFRMDELHKYKLTVLNTRYASALDRLKAPLMRKYNQMLKAELDTLAARDSECVKARRDQIECVNEIITVLGPGLPQGYAVTHLRAEEGVVIAEYAPERAGKPLPMPETVTDER